MLHHIFGLDSSEMSSVQSIQSNDGLAIMYVAGDALVIARLPSLERRYLVSGRRDGIRCFAVHPNQRFIALGERGQHPDLKVYAYPELTLQRQLRNGATEIYACVAFSRCGSKLASVSGQPDLILTIWSWKQEMMLLRCKAFGQDVLNVQFSPINSDHLITSGSGHIRFWRMAATFTGWKLQGHLGRFGKVDPTDISRFVELHNGQVLSSSDTGELLLWDSCIIKVRFRRTPDMMCHDGEVVQRCPWLRGVRPCCQVTMLLEDDGTLLTGGADGWIRRWDIQQIIGALGDHSSSFDKHIEPLEEVELSNAVPGCTRRDIRNVLRFSTHKGVLQYIVHTASGELLAFDSIPQLALAIRSTTVANARSIDSFHAGAVTAVSASPSTPSLASSGEDGTIRCWDYSLKKHLFKTLSVPASCVLWLPECLDRLPRTIVTGHYDGTLRAFYKTATSWLRIQALKPHNADIRTLAATRNHPMLISGGSDGLIFLTKCHRVGACGELIPYEPIGFVRLTNPVKYISIGHDTELVVVCSSGSLFEVKLGIGDQCPRHQYLSRDSFELDLPVFEWVVQRAENFVLVDNENIPHVSRQPFQKDGPNHHRSSVSSVRVTGAVCCCDQDAAMILRLQDGQIYMVWRATAAMSKLSLEYEAHHECEDTLFPVCMKVHAAKCLIQAYDTGTISIHAIDQSASCAPGMRMQSHSARACVTDVCVTHEDSFIVSSGSDGLVTLQEFPLLYRSVVGLVEHSHPWRSVDYGSPSVSVAGKHEDCHQFAALECPDIHEGAWSIEETKSMQEEGTRVRAAKDKRDRVQQVIKDMRSQFQFMCCVNLEIAPETRLAPCEFILDTEYRQMLEEEGETSVDAARSAHYQATEKSRSLLNKWKDSFLGDLEKVGNQYFFARRMKALQSNHRVGMFQTANLGTALKQLLNQAHANMRRSDTEVQPKLASNREATLRAVAENDVDRINGLSEPLLPPSFESSVELQKTRRLHRKAMLCELERKKPNHDSEDPRDVLAIERSQRVLGNYNLKSSPEYQVPPGAELSGTQKRLDMVLLQENIHCIKIRYNNRFLALEDVKTLVMESVRIGRYQQHCCMASAAELVSTHLYSPSLAALSLRSVSCSIRDTKMDRIDFASHMSASHRDSIAFGVIRAPDQQGADTSTPSGSGCNEGIPSAGVSVLLSAYSRFCTNKNNNEYLHLCHEALVVEARITEHVGAFDRAVRELRTEETPLHADLKAAELKLVLLLQELHLLRTFGAKDETLKAKLSKSHHDNLQVDQEMSNCSIKLHSKNVELQHWQEKERNLDGELESIVPTNHPFYMPLLQILQHRSKRAGFQQSETGKSNASNESDDDNDDDLDEDLAEECCPLGCDATYYEQTLDLRERRLENERVAAELQHSLEDLHRNLDRLHKRKKLLETDSIAFTKELQSFQTEKQKRLNEIQTVCSLSANQIYFLETNDIDKMSNWNEMNSASEWKDRRLLIPGDISHAVLFSKTVLWNLHRRISSLDVENKSERANLKELHRLKRQLQKAKVSCHAQILHATNKCNDLQMLKFGQLINMGILDRASRASHGKCKRMHRVRIRYFGL
mmetsp:Transcript_22043/g.68942  ORF Transcript_22043/g.68942 Transcript_22043/m.68942 type:complete len:1581 (+) Transcript_22043:131-4873(+)